MGATYLDNHNLPSDSMATRVKYMNNAAAKSAPTPWLYTDGLGDPDNKHEWRIVEPIIKDPPVPPANTRLSDAQVFNVLNQDIKQTSKNTNWPVDFETRGGIHPKRPPHSPTVHVRWNSKLYYVVFGEYYILCGTACKPLQQWLIGPWGEGVWRRKARLSIGQVEVPELAQRERALVVDASLFDDIEIRSPMFNWNASLSGLSAISLYDKDVLIPTASTLTAKPSRK
jgi:hypothetical protein